MKSTKQRLDQRLTEIEPSRAKAKTYMQKNEIRGGRGVDGLRFLFTYIDPHLSMSFSPP